MLADLLYRLRAIVRRSRMDRDLDEEVRLHLEREVDANLARGLPPAEAHRRARLTLGGIDQVKEAARDARGVSLLETLGRDLRYAARVLRRSPGYSLAALLTLALGIGANATIFSIVNGLLLRPLPVRDPGRLVALSQTAPDGSGQARELPFFGGATWEQIRIRPELFESVCAYQTAQVNLSDRGQADNVLGLWASGRFFDTLGVSAALGRTFTAASDQPGGGPDGPVAVISHGFWQRRFGGAQDVVGRTMRIERVTYTIVGVTPPAFFGPSVGQTFDVVLPLGTREAGGQQAGQVDQSWYLSLLARLRADQTMASATAALHAAQPAILAATAPPNLSPAQAERRRGQVWRLASAETGRSFLRDRFREPLVIVSALAGLVLLIVCASLANLSLARATARRHEMGVRRALGASGLRLAQQALIESLLLSTSGAVLGMVFASAFGRLLVRQMWLSTPVFLDLSVDWRVLSFAAAATVVTAALFGIAPALRASRVRPSEAMVDGARGRIGDRGTRLHHALVVVQVGVSLVLLVVGGLLVRTFWTLAGYDLGFDADRLLMVRVDGQRSRVDPAERAALNERVRLAAEGVPGVASAVAFRSVPISQDHWLATIEVPGEPPPSGDRRAFLNSVSPGWFEMFGTPILAGRDFGSRDHANSELVAIVNQSFARRFARGRRLIGETLRFGEGTMGPPFRIIGLVKDSGAAIYYGLREGIPPTVYFHVGQRRLDMPGFTPLVSFRIGVRAAQGDPADLVRGVAKAIEAIDPDLKTDFRGMSNYIDATMTTERVAALLAALFGVLALLLASVGLYGITAYLAGRRRAEIGVRLALGASPGTVVRAVLGRTTLLVAIGLIAGLGVSYWATRLVGALLYGLQPRDPATFAGATLVLAVVGVLAGWLPARRASRLDPVQVLRSQ